MDKFPDLEGKLGISIHLGSDLVGFAITPSGVICSLGIRLMLDKNIQLITYIERNSQIHDFRSIPSRRIDKGPDLSTIRRELSVR